MKKYDYVVVGTGAANIVTDAAIDAGKTVAIIEKGKFGGTCLNRGCIPTKTLLTPIDYKKDFERMKANGIFKGDVEINYDNLKKRMWNYITSHSAEVLQAYQAEENVDIYQGEGFFTGKRTLQVKDENGELSEEIYGEVILLANGAKTRIPPVKGLEQIDYITSETFFGEKLPEKPYESLAILGGGVIAAEFANFFANLGTKVTIIQHNPRLLPTFDDDVVQVLKDEFKAEHIELYLATEMLEIEQGEKLLNMKVENIKTGEQTMLHAEKLMIAIGLESNSKNLQVEKAGIQTDQRGWIRTNEFLETSAENVYCIGDANGKFQLRHVANYEAEIVAFNLYERTLNTNGNKLPPRRRARYDVVPAAVFTHPQLASVGLNSRMIQAKEYDIAVGEMYYSDVSKTFAMGYPEDEEKQFVKVMADKKTRRIIGVQIVGAEASVLAQIYANLMNSGEYTYEIIEEGIASPETKRERAELKKRYLDPNKVEALNYSMTIHPALSEVATWAASEVDFGESEIFNAEHI